MLYKALETKCPVCKATLGWRDKETLADFYCEECRVVFYFHPNELVPTNTKKSCKPLCGCGVCGR